MKNKNQFQDKLRTITILNEQNEVPYEKLDDQIRQVGETKNKYGPQEVSTFSKYENTPKLPLRNPTIFDRSSIV